MYDIKMPLILKTTFKFIFAFLIIYWLIQSGKLDFKLLKSAFDDPWRLTLGFGLIILNLLIVSWRYFFIICAKMNIKPSFKTILRYNWIGIFFNSFLPGSVSGDIVKVFYLKEIDKTLSKRFLLASVLIDRFVGLFGLIIILGLSSIFNYSELITISSGVSSITHFNLILLTLVALSFIFLYFFDSIPKIILLKFTKQKILKNVILKVIDAWENLCLLRSKVLIATFLSVIVQAMTVITFWFITHPYAHGNFNIEHAFSFIPIGFLIIALPIAPSGLGVGHAAFDKLFSFIQVDNGASLFNIYFILMLLGNLLGIIPYLAKNKKVSIQEVSQFD